MTDLLAALQRSVEKARELQPEPTPEDIDDVFATHGDTYQRFNSTWREGLRREPKEGSL